MFKESSRLILCLALFAGALPSAVLAQGRPNSPAPAEGVKTLRDLPYVEAGHERQKLDLYLPEKGEGPFPLIIWIHGGGWQAGSKEQCPPARQGYVAKGFAVASIGYRLSGDAVFPAQIQDCKAAVRWLRAHATEYHLDTGRFGAWGSSAGGHLVALLGTSGDVKEFDVGPNLDQSSRVQSVCDFYGPTDFTAFVKTSGYASHATADAPEAKLIGGAVLDNPDKAAKVNPIAYVSRDDPPYLIVHGDADPVVPPNQSRMLFAALKKEGISTHLHTIHGAGHGGPGFADPKIDAMVIAFFEATLKKDPKEFPVAALETESTAATSAEMPKGPGSGAGKPPGMTTGKGRGIPWEVVKSREDANHDDKVSRDEFKGPPPLFDRLDTNRDGVLSKADFAR